MILRRFYITENMNGTGDCQVEALLLAKITLSTRSQVQVKQDLKN